LRRFLSGGSALGIFYLSHRRSYDLDLFTTDPEPVGWQTLTNQLLRISGTIGANIRSLTASPDLHRFELTRDSDREILDFVIERVPQLDSRKEAFGDIRVDTLREIIANKLCTLVGRTELKDLIDLYFLEKRGYDLMTHLPDAQLN
jgi:predicted nucleotidyltransferase component of viral defense system